MQSSPVGPRDEHAGGAVVLLLAHVLGRFPRQRHAVLRHQLAVADQDPDPVRCRGRRCGLQLAMMVGLSRVMGIAPCS